ncbi:MAG: hypothetical protein KDD40_00805 [Bdellovibrionales bacterium]|nr:hypothetical protein [Bdellovibrionales bacterium]
MKEDEMREILATLDREHPLNYEFFIILNTKNVTYTLRDKVRIFVKKLLPKNVVQSLRQNRLFRIVLKFF